LIFLKKIRIDSGDLVKTWNLDLEPSRHRVGFKNSGLDCCHCNIQIILEEHNANNKIKEFRSLVVSLP
jgi:hypothetical protein